MDYGHPIDLFFTANEYDIFLAIKLIILMILRELLKVTNNFLFHIVKKKIN